MTGLLAALKQDGLLDEETERWVRATHAELGGDLGTTLLHLDVVGEDELTAAIGAHHGFAPAVLDDLGRIDADLAARYPKERAEELGICPIRIFDYGVLVWTRQPLPVATTEELKQASGLPVHQQVAPAHHVAAARQRLYGDALDPREASLEERLARRREGPDVKTTLAEVASARSLDEAVRAASTFAAPRLALSTFFVVDGEVLRTVAMRGGTFLDEAVPLPEPECSFGAALRYGGYFLGFVSRSSADQRFFDVLHRRRPRFAFVAPLPGAPVCFFGDNGPRAISPRVAAELSLIATRLAQRDDSAAWATLSIEAIPAITHEGAEGGVRQPVSDESGAFEETPEAGEAVVEAAAERAPPAEIAPAAPAVGAAELRVLARLKERAAAAETDLETFVDALLGASARPPDASSSALAGEVKELFERLATDIPAQLARGMEAAFRDLGPRIGTAAPPPAAGAPGPPSAARAADLVVVKKDAGPREVPSYRSKRAKTKRRKL